MQKALLICLLFGFSIQGYSQETPLEISMETPTIETSFKTQNKGKFYFYWGWNKAQYSYSDITFRGDDYDFTLYDVAAKDRQNPWDARRVFEPYKYHHSSNRWQELGIIFMTTGIISIGVDHMKYIMVEQQPATIDGYIDLKIQSQNLMVCMTMHLYTLMKISWNLNIPMDSTI